MAIFLNLLPYMNRIEDSAELFERWKGGVEIPMDGPNWREPVNWHHEFSRFADHPGPISVHSPIWELNLATPRFDLLRNYSLDVYRECLAWSAKIGAEQMVIHPSFPVTPLFLRKESQECSKDSLRKLGEEARKLGIELAVENVGFREHALFDQEEFVRLFEEIPEITALVDVGHAHINGWDIPLLIRQLGTRLSALHLHDNDGYDDLHQPVGEGTIVWEPIWEALRELNHGYRAILEYQWDTPLETMLKDAEAIEKKL